MFHCSHYCFLFVFGLGLNILPAQIRENPVRIFFNYLQDGTINTFKDSSNRWILGVAALGTAAAAAVDDKFQDYAQNNGLLPKNISRFGDIYGGGRSNWILFSALVLDGVYKQDWKKGSRAKFEYALLSIGVNGFVTEVLKKGVGRERPNKMGNQSFPSGHTSNSFVIAAVSNEIFGSIAGISAYTIAGLVAVSRINDNKHYLSDVIFGAGLGTAIGRGFAYPYRKRNMSITLLPALNGITAIFYF
ncbi:MAG: phosphatase PAP2 family protein [Candidatus Neomarinimicrobiota bacterium]